MTNLLIDTFFFIEEKTDFSQDVIFHKILRKLYTISLSRANWTIVYVQCAPDYGQVPLTRSVFAKGKCNVYRSECRVESDQMKPERRCPCTGAQNCVGHASKEIRFEREPTAFKRGEHACNVYRSNARHERESCGGWFAGRLHNTILRHNDCNALMHFGTVHRADRLPIEDASRAPLAAL